MSVRIDTTVALGWAVAETTPGPDGPAYLRLGPYNEVYPTRAPADRQAAACRGDGTGEVKYAVVQIILAEEPR